ncbi:MAG TPA: hypothetical protein DDW65_16395 [Firmicutes bacterium]|nr:hypothetical protein [Bacillota bacterium]
MHVSMKAYLFLAPFLLFFIFVVVYPVGYAGYLSLFGQRGARMWFVGLSNYSSILTDEKFWQGFGIPVFLLLVQIPAMLILAIFIGLLYERIKHSEVYRLIFYLPYAIPAVIASIIWSYIFSKTMSPFIPLLKFLGFGQVQLITLSCLPWILLIIILWEWTGYTSLIIYAALLSIPKEYTEQASIDGANYFQAAFYIKVPLLKNTVLILFIFNAIGALQIFNETWMLGGVGNFSLMTLPPNYTPAMYVYHQAFNYGAFTYSIAMALILAAIIFIFSFAFMKMSAKVLQSHE